MGVAQYVTLIFLLIFFVICAYIWDFYCISVTRLN